MCGELARPWGDGDQQGQERICPYGVPPGLTPASKQQLESSVGKMCRHGNKRRNAGESECALASSTASMLHFFILFQASFLLMVTAVRSSTAVGKIETFSLSQ